MAEMGVYEAMRTLKAVRRLKPDPIPDDVLHRVLEAATWAPTGGNQQPWRIIAVKDRAKKTQPRRVVCGAMERVLKDVSLGAFRRHGRRRAQRMTRTLNAGDYLAQHFGETPVIAIFCFNPKQMAITDAKQNRPSVVGGGSVYPSVENLLIACRAEGLGCVLTTLLCEVEPQVKELLAIPEGWGTAAAIPIGYPVGRGHGPLIRRPVSELAYLDAWGNRLA